MGEQAGDTGSDGDGRTLLTAERDGDLGVWDAATLRPRDRHAGAAGRQLHVRYARTGGHYSRRARTAGLYGLGSDTRRRGLEAELHAAGTYAGRLNFQDLGTVVFDFPRDRAVVFESEKASTVDLRTGARTGRALDRGHDWYWYPSISDDGRRLAVGFATATAVFGIWRPAGCCWTSVV